MKLLVVKVRARDDKIRRGMPTAIIVSRDRVISVIAKYGLSINKKK